MNREREQLKEQIKAYEQIIEELSAPIIPSIIPDTMLVPLMGTLTEQRFRHIQTKILEVAATERADMVLVDFTGIHLKDISQLGMQELSHQIGQLHSALCLMGIETIFVGFSPEFVRGIVLAGLDVSRFTIHATFRTALQYVMGQKGLRFEAIGK